MVKQVIARFFLRRPSLHARVIISVVIVCLMLIGLDGWRTWKGRVIQIAEDKTETANLAKSLGQHAHDTIQSVDTAIIGLRDIAESEEMTSKSFKRMQLLMKT